MEGGIASDDVPSYVEKLAGELPAYTKRELRGQYNPVLWCPAIFRGIEIEDWADLWWVYFFRFVEPRRRTGPLLNYADRIRNATAWLLPGGWAAIESRTPATKDG